jgi:large subunit ribosomal protein L15
MDILSNLKYASGSRKKTKRVARGEGSGHGGTATRGMNGQMSRSGSKHKAWFEGGQMPLQRRIPKVGFTNHFKKYYQVVNIDTLQKMVDNKGVKDEVLNAETLKKYGVVTSSKLPVKILGNGEIKAKLNLQVNAYTKSAKEKIEAAGGKIEKI